MKKSVFLIALLIIIATFAYFAFLSLDKSLNQDRQLFQTTPTIILDPATIINEVQSLARLETIQYSMEKVITAQTNQDSLGFLFGDKLLFVAHGQVIAGVDLELLTLDDLEYRDGVLYVTLPAAEVFVATLDNEKSYVYDRETGVFAPNTADLETAARQSAEQAILQAALEDGILDQAQINAENYLARLFRNLGYPDVVFLEPAN